MDSGDTISTRRPCGHAIAMLLAVVASLTPPTAASARLGAQPTAIASFTPPAAARILDLPGGAKAYVPAGVGKSGPAPLLLLFHGSGGNGPAMLRAFRHAGDRDGFIVLAPSARGENWDAVDRFFDDYEAGREKQVWPAPTFGEDAKRIDAALAALFLAVPVDRRRIGVLGFSHGASYALMLGTANPHLFSSIVALSPGILILEKDVPGQQRVFISHGTQDATLSYARTHKSFVPRLAALGYPVTFRPFKGGHSVHPDALAEAIAFFLKR